VSGSASDRTCALCGRDVGYGWLMSGLGERFCVTHDTLPGCPVCGAPVAAGPYCPGCAATGVTTQHTVRAVLPAIRADLHRLGIRLTRPVQVELVASQVIEHLTGPWDAAARVKVSGATISAGTRVLRLTVVEGLPLMRFGAVVAHEAMHAWMAQRGFRADLAAPLREGLCQLTAFSWLRRQQDPRAALIRRTMELDPDPDYGEGFRRVRDAVLRGGLKPVLSALHGQGRLP
jgi:hypothetical protein